MRRPAGRTRRCRAAVLLLAASVLVAEACAATTPPYPHSRLVRSVLWDFSGLRSMRKAHGSDLWPLTWGADGALYGAWGDGGGFQGDSDFVGRVSLGFARITGSPRQGEPASYAGVNLWGDAPRYAQAPASFGGKVGTMLSLGGVLYAHGGLWLGRAGVAKWEAGNTNTAVWSTDAGRSWHVASWSSRADLGSFVNFGRDYAGAMDGYVYMYYGRAGDATHVYLKRAPMSRLLENPDTDGHYQYFSGAGAHRAPRWSREEASAVPVFFDPNHALGPEAIYDAGLHRFLLTIGHAPTADDRDASAGQVGLFEAPHPWGPWHTIDYQDDWGHLGAQARGDYLGLHLPTAWISADGRSLWAVFSSLHQYDSFNLVRVRLILVKKPS